MKQLVKIQGVYQKCNYLLSYGQKIKTAAKMTVVQASTMEQLSAPFPTAPHGSARTSCRSHMGKGHCGQERLSCGLAVADRGWLLHLEHGGQASAHECCARRGRSGQRRPDV